MHSTEKFLKLAAVAAVVVVLTLSGQATATFTVDGVSYETKFYDDFNDNSIDGTKWPVATYITESGGALRHTTTLKKTTTSANFSSEFTGATEWAYLFNVTVPTTMTSVSNRLGYVFQTEDLSLCAFKNSSSVWQLWAGNGGYYTTSPFYYKSGNLNLGQAYTIAVHKQAGVNQYDIFIDGTEVASDVASTRYTGVEVPGTVTFGHASSTGNCPAIFDYMYAGLPLPQIGDLTINKFFDCDQNGVYEPGEADKMLSGWNFTIKDPGDAYVLDPNNSDPNTNMIHTTNLSGQIALTDLPIGDYTITETVKKDHVVTGAGSPRVVTISGDTETWFGNWLVADINQDGIVDSQDFSVLKANFGKDPALWTDGNINLTDSLVDSQDFSILKANFGKGVAPGSAGGSPVPEPATLSLLAMGLLGVLRRRRA